MMLYDDDYSYIKHYIIKALSRQYGNAGDIGIRQTWHVRTFPQKSANQGRE